MPDLGSLRGSAVGGSAGSAGASGASGSAGSAGSSGASASGGDGGSAGSAGAGQGGSGSSDPDGCGLDVPGVIQFDFDAGLSGRIAGAWGPYPEGSTSLTDSSVGWNENDGHTCPGALQLDVPFGAWGDKVAVTLNFQADWDTPTPYAAMHAWVKIALPADGGSLNYNYLHGAQISVSSGPNYEAYRNGFASGPVFADGDWHELVILLDPVDPPPLVNAYVPSAVRQIGAQIIAATAQPAGGPTRPGDASLLLDDIWLEE